MLSFASSFARPSTQSRSLGLPFRPTSSAPSSFQLPHARRATIRAVASAGSNALNVVPDVQADEADDEERRSLTLTDKDSGLDLDVFVFEEFDFEGRSYTIVVPQLDPISIVRCSPVDDVDGDGYQITNVDDYKPLIPAARAALQEEKMDIVQVGFIGMVLDEDMALDDEILEEADDADDDHGVEGDDDAIEVEVLAEFEQQGVEYSVIRQTSLQFLVTAKDADGEHRIVNGAELAELQSFVEEKVVAWKDQGV